MDTTYEDELMDILARVQADLAEVRGAGPRNHGTRAGYARHLRNKTTPCDECRAANAEHVRRQREKERAKPVVRKFGRNGRYYRYTFRNWDEYKAYDRGDFDPLTRMESAVEIPSLH